MAPPTQQQPIDSKASLTDARFPSERFLSDSPSTQCSASARLLRAEGCDDGASLYDEQRMIDRGYVVLKGAAPPDELAAMAAFVNAQPLPTRLLCGASDVQPVECMHHGEQLQERYPQTFSAITTTLQRWIRSGLNERAALGWPLTISGSEFISINKWPFVYNASCVLSHVFSAAEALVDPRCIESSCEHPSERTDSLAFCWQACYFEAIVERMPANLTTSVLKNAMDPERAVCDGPLLPLFDGPIEHIMGGNDFYSFGKWGSKRLVSNLKAWLTKMSNVSIYQGWHDWHTDGPAHYGRYHKAFLMVQKGDGDGSRPVNRERTNVALIPSHKFYAHGECFADFSSADSPEAMHDAPLLNNSDQTKRRSWGFHHRWHGFERLGCAIPMDPGDVIIWREDVWHRTQDMEDNRIALIMDILRWPLSEQPVNANPLSNPPPPPPRMPQPALVSLLLRLPPQTLTAALTHDKAALCDEQRVNSPSFLNEQGFAVGRRAVSASAAAAALVGLETRKILKTELAGGRVYTDLLTLGQLYELSPDLVDHLQELLNTWHANGWLPRSDFEGPWSRPPILGEGQFIVADPKQFHRLQSAEPSTRYRYDWHVDGDGYKSRRMHKLWLLLKKEESQKEHANIVVASSAAFEAVGERALQLDPSPTLTPAATDLMPGSELYYRREALLEASGCTLHLNVGDVAFLAEDTLHRTQDLLADRVALLINVITSEHER